MSKLQALSVIVQPKYAKVCYGLRNTLKTNSIFAGGTILPTNVRRYRVLLLISHFKFIYYFLVEKAVRISVP